MDIKIIRFDTVGDVQKWGTLIFDLAATTFESPTMIVVPSLSKVFVRMNLHANVIIASLNIETGLVSKIVE